MAERRVISISITVYGGNLIPADTTGMDIERSQDRYCEMLAQRIRAEYPDAEVSVALERDMEGAQPAPYITVACGCNYAASYEAEREVLLAISAIGEGMGDEWVVPSFLSTAEAATALGNPRVKTLRRGRVV